MQKNFFFYVRNYLELKIVILKKYYLPIMQISRDKFIGNFRMIKIFIVCVIFVMNVKIIRNRHHCFVCRLRRYL